MIITRAPLRVSFFGGGTDYPEHFLKHGGAVLATAIDKFSYITISPFQSSLFDYRIKISYRKAETVKRVKDIKHNVFRECLKYCGLTSDIEIHTVADLPAFTGLGSSSAFTVALLQALHAYKGEYLTPLNLAYEAIHIERNILHDKVGCQDQTVAAVGGFNFIEFKKEDDIIVHQLNLSPLQLEEFENHLILVYTGIKRKASEVIAKQLVKVEANIKTLNNIRKMTDKAVNILTNWNSLDEFGKLLHNVWIEKKKLDGDISNKEIDEMYKLGLKAGATGGKLLGAGSGGFLLFFVPIKIKQNFLNTFKDHHIINFKINASNSEVIFASSL